MQGKKAQEQGHIDLGHYKIVPEKGFYQRAQEQVWNFASVAPTNEPEWSSLPQYSLQLLYALSPFFYTLNQYTNLR